MLETQETCARAPTWLDTVKYRAGLDRAIVYTASARVLQGAGSVVTVLLLVHFLTKVEQGYYYTLWSLVALQVVFELGFSFVILQIAAHERVHLEFHANGFITGDDRAHQRLALLLQRAVLWYLIAAVVMGIAMIAGATHFFAMRQAGDASLWTWPLRVTVIACCVTFSIGPVLSFLEGTGMVAIVARTRFLQAFVASGLAWIAMGTHHGLFAPAMVLTGQGAVAAWLIFQHRRLLLPLMRKVTDAGVIDWRVEVWQFQWRIAVSWICDYFIFQMFTPVLFAFRGPVEAGQMGLSMSAVTQLGGIVLAWMSTKAAPFGSLVARRDFDSLDRLFFRTLRQSLVIFAGGATLLLCAFALITMGFPRFAGRIVSWPVFSLLLLTAASNHVVQSFALYLRAHKVEPFLLQSIVVATATTILVLLAVRPWGTIGVALAYFATLGIGGLLSAWTIFFRMRARWHGAKTVAIADAHPLEDGAI